MSAARRLTWPRVLLALAVLLARAAALAGAAPRDPRASWPDSFFDDDAQP